MSKCYWITGLSASGKTTMSTLLVDYLKSFEDKVILLDGDELRRVLADKSYTREERVALGMRYSRLCQLIVSQDVDVVIAVIGLFKEIHEWNRDNIYGYTEVFIDVPMSELKRRDPKGLYAKYDDGQLKNIAGVDLNVDFPANPDISLKWIDGQSIELMFQELIEKLGEIRK
jgi:cytidine diphosphoramidate kinase